MDKLTYLIPIVFGLMILVNIFTEVLKKVLWDKVPTNLLVLALSLVITICALFIYLTIANIAFVWWMLLIAIVVAVCVAYSAMFGFDKFRQLIDQVLSMKSQN